MNQAIKETNTTIKKNSNNTDMLEKHSEELKISESNELTDKNLKDFNINEELIIVNSTDYLRKSCKLEIKKQSLSEALRKNLIRRQKKIIKAVDYFKK